MLCSHKLCKSVWGPTWETLKKKGLAFAVGSQVGVLLEEIGVWSMLKFLIGSLDFPTRGRCVITIDSC